LKSKTNLKIDFVDKMAFMDFKHSFYHSEININQLID